MWYHKYTENSIRAQNHLEGGMRERNMKDGKLKVSKKRILEELAQIGFARVPDYLQVQDERLLLSLPEEGNPAGAAVASVEKGSGSWKVKFYDKMKALELLGKHLGMFSGSTEPEEKQKSNLLECILQATGEEVDLHDIPEIQQAADAGAELVESAGS